MDVDFPQTGERHIWLWILFGFLALAGIVAAVAGVLADPERFFRAYLFAYLFWVGISFGCLGWLLLHNITGSRWGFALQRVLEAGARTLPLMALLFLPLLFGFPALYPWSTAPARPGPGLFLSKSSYLNVPFFVIRAVIYFAVCIGLTMVVTHWSYASDHRRPADPDVEAQMWQDRVRLGAVGLFVFTLVANFAAYDWLMSLEPQWFSSLFGWLALARHALGALVFAIIVLALIRSGPRARLLRQLLNEQALNDMGAVFLATLVSLTYLALMQFLVIWAGNIPEDATWYVIRSRGGWQWVLGILVVFYLGLPIFLLLLRRVKRHLGLMTLLAALVLLLRFLHLYWLVMPVFQPTVAVHWLDVALPLGMGGFWLAVFGWQLLRHPLLPANHPKARQALAQQAR
jgi:hypothetical protein